VLFAAFVGIAFGVVAALRRNGPTDHVLRVASLAGISMPTFWIALVALYVGFYKLNWFPGAGPARPRCRPAAEYHRAVHESMRSCTATSGLRDGFPSPDPSRACLAAFNSAC